MLLREYTSFGLRILLYLGTVQDDRPVRVPVLMEKANASKSSLHKLLNFMAHQGWIVIHRGRWGGYRINEKVLSVGLGTVVSILEKDENVVDCTKSKCPFRNSGCPFVDPMKEATRGFYAELNKITIGELIRKRQEALVLKQSSREILIDKEH